MKTVNIKDQKLRLVFNIENGRLNAMLKEKEKLEFDIEQSEQMLAFIKKIDHENI